MWPTTGLNYLISATICPISPSLRELRDKTVLRVIASEISWLPESSDSIMMTAAVDADTLFNEVLEAGLPDRNMIRIFFVFFLC